MPGKLVRSRAFTAFQCVDKSTGRATGKKLSGVTRRLEEHVWSGASVVIPTDASKPRATSGGFRRGKLIDAQVTRMVNTYSAKARGEMRMMRLTRMCFLALQHHRLEPLIAQRVVVDARRGIATACDVVCHRKTDNAIVIVELKTGYACDRSSGIIGAGRKALKMKSPLSTAKDSIVHRHLAQLAVTHALFCSEEGTLEEVKALGVSNIEGAVLYVCETYGSELFALTDWWKRRQMRLLDAISP